MQVLKSFNIPLYRGKLVVMLTDDKQFIKQYIPDFDNNSIYAHTINAPFKGKDGYYIILNPKNRCRKIYAGTIAHEALHVTSFLFDNRGLKLDMNNDEAQAYLLEWIVDIVFDVINKY